MQQPYPYHNKNKALGAMIVMSSQQNVSLHMYASNTTNQGDHMSFIDDAKAKLEDAHNGLQNAARNVSDKADEVHKDVQEKANQVKDDAKKAFEDAKDKADALRRK